VYCPRKPNRPGIRGSSGPSFAGGKLGALPALLDFESSQLTPELSPSERRTTISLGESLPPRLGKAGCGEMGVLSPENAHHASQIPAGEKWVYCPRKAAGSRNRRGRGKSGALPALVAFESSQLPPELSPSERRTTISFGESLPPRLGKAGCGEMGVLSPENAENARFTSLAVINLRRDLHPQECAMLGAHKKRAPEGARLSEGC